MLKCAARVGVAVLCAFFVSSCTTLGIASSRTAKVDIITTNQTPACHYLGDVVAESSYPTDSDLHAAVTTRAQVLAAQKGADSILIQSLAEISSPAAAEQSKMILRAKSYACRQEGVAP